MLMPEGATLLNTARKEIVNEADLLRMFADRKDFRYVTDVAPDCSAELEAKYQGRYFATPKKWVPKPKRLISMQDWQLPGK